MQLFLLLKNFQQFAMKSAILRRFEEKRLSNLVSLYNYLPIQNTCPTFKLNVQNFNISSNSILQKTVKRKRTSKAFSNESTAFMLFYLLPILPVNFELFYRFTSKFKNSTLFSVTSKYKRIKIK